MSKELVAEIKKRNDEIQEYNKLNKFPKPLIKPTLLPKENVQIGNNGVLTVQAGKTESSNISLIISTQGLITDSLYILPLIVAKKNVVSEVQTLYYIISIRDFNVSNLPLDDIFTTVFYVNTDEYQPLIAGVFKLEKKQRRPFKLLWEHTIGNIVNLKTVTVGYDVVANRTLLNLSKDIQYVLENAYKYIQPLQDQNRKICICIQGGGKGIGFCNMTDAQIADFTAQVKKVVVMYNLDGINLWDEGAAYGKEGMPPANTTSYPKLIKALREAMPDKLLTLVDKDEPTEYFHDAAACGGIEVGKYIDYAWHGYNSEKEVLQIVDPWSLNNPYSKYQRKPIAGLSAAKYGCINSHIYPSVDESTLLMPGLDNLVKWRQEGKKQSNIVVFSDLITNLQGKYEGAMISTLTQVFSYFPDDGRPERTYLYMIGDRDYASYYGTLSPENYGKWLKDW